MRDEFNDLVRAIAQNQISRFNAVPGGEHDG